jgi:hypothetical protein
MPFRRQKRGALPFFLILCCDAMLLKFNLAHHIGTLALAL